MSRANRLNLVAELSLAGLLVASLAACNGKIGGDSTSGAGGSGTGSGGSVSGSGGSGNGSGSGGSGNGSGSGGSSDVDGGAPAMAGQTNVITCSPGIASTSQIPRMADAQYDNAISDLLGVKALTSNSNQPPSALLSPDSMGSLDTISWNGYQTAAAAIAAQVFASSTTTANFMSCNPATNTATCLTNTIQAFGRKAFRRPLTTTEVSSFMALNSVTPAGTPHPGGAINPERVPGFAVVHHAPRADPNEDELQLPAQQLRGGGASLFPVLELRSGRDAQHRRRQQSADDQGPDPRPGAALAPEPEGRFDGHVFQPRTTWRSRTGRTGPTTRRTTRPCTRRSRRIRTHPRWPRSVRSSRTSR